MILYDNDAYREEFIELVYDLLHDDGTNDRANQIIAMFDSVPEVDAEPLQPNGPLTLEELREMDGEPVWIVHLDVPGKSRWHLIDGYSQERLLFREKYGGYMWWDEMGAVWLAYRRKPEEGNYEN